MYAHSKERFHSLFIPEVIDKLDSEVSALGLEALNYRIDTKTDTVIIRFVGTYHNGALLIIHGDGTKAHYDWVTLTGDTVRFYYLPFVFRHLVDALTGSVSQYDEEGNLMFEKLPFVDTD